MKQWYRHWWFWAVVLLAGASATGAAWWWHEAARARAIIADSVPPHPDLGGLPAELMQRVSRSESQARHGPHRREGLAELSRLYHANGFLAEAARCYEGLLQVDPTNPRWAHRFAAILAGYGRLEDALPLLRRVVALDPAYVPARLRLGDALLKLNRNTEAATVYAAVLTIDPGNPYAGLGLARIDVDAGRWAEARTRLEGVVRRSDFMVGYDLLPTVYEHLGQGEAAAAIRARMKASGAFVEMRDPWIDDLIDDCYNTYRLSVAAGTADHRNDPQTAIRLLQRALVLAPDSGPLHFQIALIELAQKNYAEAKTHLVRCTELTPKFPDGWAYLNKLYGTLGETSAAARAVAEGLVQCPNSPGLHLAYGRQLVAAGRYRDAIPEFRRSIELRPDEADAYVELASTHFRLNEIPQGVAELRRSLEIEPENPTALTTLTLYSISVGDEAAARNLLHQVQRQVRVEPETLARLTQAFQAKFGRSP